MVSKRTARKKRWTIKVVKCGHLCHCIEADHDGCKCDNCDCNGEQAEQATYEHSPQTSGELVIDDTNDCEWCQ